MVSDIKGLDARQPAAARSNATGKLGSDSSSVGGSRNDGGSASEDRVQLSGLSEAIKVAARALASESPVDEGRVRDIKESIANGSYEVDPERLARKLIDADNT